MRSFVACLRVAVATACVASMFVPSTSRAMSYSMPTDEELVSKADGVVTARVVDELTPISVGGIGHRRYRLQIENALTGTPLHGEAVLRFPGAVSYGDFATDIEGMPQISVGDKVLVFHAAAAKGELAVVDLALGVFFETVDADGRKSYVRELVEDGSLGKRDRREYGWARDAAAFEAWLAAGASGRSAAPRYWATDAKGAPLAVAKFNLARNVGVPRRWFEFDSNLGVDWRAVAGGPAGATDFNFATAVPAALNAWSNDLKSRIILRYTGTVTAAQADSGNVVVWDDPTQIMPGAYNCSSGILAFTQTIITSARLRFDATEYNQIFAFAAPNPTKIVVQDGVACHFNAPAGTGGADGVEVLAHEFGHTLGLAHSCGDVQVGGCLTNTDPDDALMRATVHRLGRGALLGLDDAIGVRTLYPDPTYVHPRERMVDGVSTRLTGCSQDGSRDISSSADGSVMVYQTTCSGAAGKAGQSMIMVLDRKQCAKQLQAKADDARCSEKNWSRYTKAQPVNSGIEPSISADGRYAVFVAPPGLPGSVPLGTNSPSQPPTGKQASGWAIYMQNLIGGTTFQMGGGVGIPDGVGTQPLLSPDASAITFVSTSLPENGLGELPDATPDVFQIKPTFGIGGDPTNPGTPICASCKNGQGQAAGPPAANANGGIVSYSLGNALWLTNMLSGSSSQMVPAAIGVSSSPNMNYGGGAVVFTTTAALDDDDSDTNGKEDVYTYDICCDKFTRISKPDEELPNPADQEPSGQPVFSGDGRRIAFVSRANNLMGFEPELNGFDNVFTYDLTDGVKRRLSRTFQGTQTNGPSGRPFLNYGGDMLLFESSATNLNGPDPDINGVQDVFQRVNPQSEFSLFYSGLE